MALDRIFRSRLEGTPVSSDDNPNLKLLAKWSNDDLEGVLEILFSLIDGYYKNRALGVKLITLRLAEFKKL